MRRLFTVPEYERALARLTFNPALLTDRDVEVLHHAGPGLGLVAQRARDRAQSRRAVRG
jgi:hypothetical protein